MKYKLIDLLIMRSKGESLPAKIGSVQYALDKFCWDEDEQDYKHIEDGGYLLSSSDEYGIEAYCGVWSTKALSSEWQVIEE